MTVFRLYIIKQENGYIELEEIWKEAAVAYLRYNQKIFLDRLRKTINILVSIIGIREDIQNRKQEY
jgi:hypothetical protein